MGCSEKELRFVTGSPEETQAIAVRMAEGLRGGEVIAFTGGMGAGKTTFTAGLAQGLGSAAWVSSPTFALVHQYQGKIPLCHFDLFRISSLEDLYSTGFFDYLDTDRVLAIEWSENIEGALPEDAIFVDIRPGDGETQRIITVRGWKGELL